MAFIRLILNRCQEDGCKGEATHECRTSRNELFGRFCLKHAQICHDRLVKEEQDALPSRYVGSLG